MQRFVVRRVADPHLVADLTAEVFLAVIRSAHTYRPDRGSVVGWLYGVAHNVVSAERRRRAREHQANERAAGRRELTGEELAVDDDHATPAYAVVSNDDGTISVRVERYEDAEGLAAQLAEHGVSARVDYVPAGMACEQPRFESSDPNPGPRAVSLALDPAELVGKTLVIELNFFPASRREPSAHPPLNIVAAIGSVAPLRAGPGRRVMPSRG